MAENDRLLDTRLQTRIIGKSDETLLSLYLETVWDLHGPYNINVLIKYMSETYQAQRALIEYLQLANQPKDELAQYRDKMIDELTVDLEIRLEDLERYKSLLRQAEKSLEEQIESNKLGCTQYAELSEKCTLQTIELESLKSELTDYHETRKILEQATFELQDIHEKREKEFQAHNALLNESAALRHAFETLQHLQEETKGERDRAIRLYVQEKDARTKQAALIARLSARLNALLPRRKHDTCPDWLRALLLQLANHCCMRCGGIEELQIDRFYPGSHGGQYVLMNTGVLCKTCNQAKSDNLGREWQYWLRDEHIPFLSKCEVLYLKQKNQMRFDFGGQDTGHAHGIG